MPTRQHIHLICDPKDPSLYRLQDALTIFCEKRASLSKDLLCTGNEAANYSWRCINRCDMVFMLLGKSYGELTNTGVSQLHISYLNSKTKHKPLAVFVLDGVERPKRLSDLLDILTGDSIPLYNIKETSDLATLFDDAYTALLTPSSLHTTTHLSPTQPNVLRLNKAKTASPKKPPPPLFDELLLNCTAHAFRGGTLIEATFMAGTTWHAILEALAQYGGNFSLQTLWRILSDLVAHQAMAAVKQQHPDVHAISRCQVTKADVFWIEDELNATNLICAAPPNTAGKPTWKLTDIAKKTL